MAQQSGPITVRLLYTMRANEFIIEDSGATVSGGIATVAQPIGTVITRQPKQVSGKYMNTAPVVTKRKTKNAR